MSFNTRQDLPTLPSAAETLARDARLAGHVSQTVVEQVLLGTKLPQAASRKNVIPKGKSKVQSMVLGLYSYGGSLGISRGTQQYPETTRLLAALAHQARPGFLFSSIQVNLGFAARPHVDRGNLGASLIIGIGPYRDGALWVEDQAGDDVHVLSEDISKHYCVDKKVRGFKVDVKDNFFEFDGNKLHFALPFKGTRCTLVYFVSDQYSRAKPEMRIALGNAGFNFLWCSPQLNVMKTQKDEQRQGAISPKSVSGNKKANEMQKTKMSRIVSKTGVAKPYSVVLLGGSSKAIDGKEELADQAVTILKTLKALGGESDLDKLCRSLVKNGLKTVQTPRRIFAFYRKKLVKRRYIVERLGSTTIPQSSRRVLNTKLKRNPTCPKPKTVVLMKKASKVIGTSGTLQPQAVTILKVLKALGGKSDVAKLCDSLVKYGLETVQTPRAIFSFYRKELISQRYITES